MPTPTTPLEAFEQRLSRGISLVKQGATIKQAAKRARCCSKKLGDRLKMCGLTTKRQKRIQGEK